MNNVEKARNLGILDDLLENHTEEDVNNMTPREILHEWLMWEGIQGYTNMIVKIFNTFFKEEAKS